MTFDLCVIGHITQDRVEIAGAPPKLQPGGTAYYAGVAAQRLGLRTAVVTRMHHADRGALLGDLEALGVTVKCLPSPATTRFVNRYPGPSHDVREQRVTAVAAPFRPEDLDVDARCYLLGPLTQHEGSGDCIRHLAGKGRRVALDVQGLLRDIRDECVVPAVNDEVLPLLACVDVVKAGAEEARRLTGAPTAEAAARVLGAAGPEEALITSGSRGSLILTGGRCVAIPAYRPAAIVDATGCGDTYLAAYLARRLAGDAAGRAGHVAAAIAGAKTAYHGAYRGTQQDVRAAVDTLTKIA